MPVSFCVCFAERQAEIKERNQKKEDACLFVFVHFHQNQKWNKKDLDLVSCTAVYIDLGKLSITILDKWLIGKLRKSFGEMSYT